jgi:hypothetical protein
VILLGALLVRPAAFLRLTLINVLWLLETLTVGSAERHRSSDFMRDARAKPMTAVIARGDR